MAPRPGNSTDSPQTRYEAYKALGDQCASTGDCATAVEYYTEAAVARPGEPGPYLGLGVLAMQQGELNRAARAFLIACRIAPDCAEAWGGLAMTQQRRGDYGEAMESYMRCLELDGDNLVALLGLFQTSCKLGTFARIIRCLELYLAGHPGDASVLFCLASLYHRDGRLPEARAALLDVLTLQPGKAEAADLLQTVNTAMGRGP